MLVARTCATRSWRLHSIGIRSKLLVHLSATRLQDTLDIWREYPLYFNLLYSICFLAHAHNALRRALCMQKCSPNRSSGNRWCLQKKTREILVGSTRERTLVVAGCISGCTQTNTENGNPTIGRFKVSGDCVPSRACTSMRTERELGFRKGTTLETSTEYRVLCIYLSIA